MTDSSTWQRNSGRDRESEKAREREREKRKREHSKYVTTKAQTQTLGRRVLSAASALPLPWRLPWNIALRM